MVANKNKVQNKLHREITGKGYRLKGGYDLIRCKKAKCGYKIRKTK